MTFFLFRRFCSRSYGDVRKLRNNFEGGLERCLREANPRWDPRRSIGSAGKTSLRVSRSENQFHSLNRRQKSQTFPIKSLNKATLFKGFPLNLSQEEEELSKRSNLPFGCPHDFKATEVFTKSQLKETVHESFICFTTLRASAIDFESSGHSTAWRR